MASDLKTLEKPFLGLSFAELWTQRIHGAPDSLALTVFGPRLEKQAFTNLQLSHEIERARSIIRQRGTESVIATAMSNSNVHVIWILATWLEGRTLCPLNPADGDTRNQQKMSQVGEPLQYWPEDRARAELDKQNEVIIPDSSPNSLNGRPMALVFTSGSTGYSKIVELGEEQILANAWALKQHHHLDQSQVIVTPLPLFHVNALMFSLFSGMVTGAQLVLVNFANPLLLPDIIQSESGTIVSVVPHILSTLLDRVEANRWQSIPSLKYFVTAASALSPQLSQRLVNEFPVQVIQGYGLSEAVNFSCTNLIDMSRDEYVECMTRWSRPSIGVALWGNEVAVWDLNQQEVAPGVQGEVMIRGRNVMRGYREDTKREIFVKEWLRTGDLGYYQINLRGQKIYFISGRSKDTAKRLGHTVSLVEIDDVLSYWPQWGARAIAVAFDHSIQGEELAVVIQGTAQEAPIQELIELLESELPEYMRPRFIFTTSLAVRTASGKPLRWPLREKLSRYSDQMSTTKVIYVGEII